MQLPSDYRISLEKSADTFMGVPLYGLFVCLFVFQFFLVTFNILSLIFVSLITLSQCVPPWVYPTWDCLSSLDLADYFFSHVREVLSHYLFKYFLESFVSLSCPFGTPVMQMLVCVLLYQRSLRLSSFLFQVTYPFFCLNCY